LLAGVLAALRAQAARLAPFLLSRFAALSRRTRARPAFEVKPVRRPKPPPAWYAVQAARVALHRTP